MAEHSMQIFSKDRKDVMNMTNVSADCIKIKLDLCDTPEQLDRLLETIGCNTVKEKLGYLFDYMQVKGVAYTGGVDEDEQLQYDLAKDIFLAGNWRSICAHT